ncbi:hypothetical protein [Tamlana sp. I1]|uniref:hypothetical protein n=1 Tax=Tamlana sp. I1 TaxID=2762061 RepID=UPI0018908D56|nr:hypothetical protein [Tamlana sp. I1]
MFNLLRSKKKEFGFKANPSLKSFGKDLNEAQISAMIHTFLLVMMAEDAVLNLKMYNYIHEQFECLGFDLKQDYVYKYAKTDDNQAYSILKKLSMEQKKWYAISLRAMLFDIGVKASKNQILQFELIGDKTYNPYVKQEIVRSL